VDLDLLQTALRVLLALVAMSHLAEGAVRPRGTAWRLPLAMHVQTVAATVSAFGVALVMLVLFDLRMGGGPISIDVGLLAFVEMALVVPPWNAITDEGITLAGRRYRWRNYLGHSADEPEGGYQRVRLEYRVWKFAFHRRFHAPPSVVRAIEDRVRPPQGRRKGMRGPRKRGWA